MIVRFDTRGLGCDEIAAGDVVYLRDASGAGRRTAERLVEHEPRAVIRDGNLSVVADAVLFERSVPVVPVEDVPVREVDELAIVDEGTLDSAWKGNCLGRPGRTRTELLSQDPVGSHNGGRWTAQRRWCQHAALPDGEGSAHRNLTAMPACRC